MSRRPRSVAAAFTLLEVMIAIAFLGIALVALLALHHSDMQAVIRGKDLTQAAMLAQALMSQAELERFPPRGQERGDFSQIYPGLFPNFRWQREVEQSTLYPTIERVHISVIYGPGWQRHFDLTEFMHNPAQPTTLLPGQTANSPTGNSTGPATVNPGLGYPGTGAN
jgi:type II secretion system protein I